jgi:superfamily II DNA or RNA helicase
VLKTAEFKTVYATGEDEPIEFFLEALMHGKNLDFGLGYFSSSGFRALSVGFAFFISKGGKMRMIINEYLSKEDIQAIQRGRNLSPDELIEEKIIHDVVELEKTLSRNDRHFFNCISWLISTNRLDLIAITPIRENVGIAHQKFGVFTDENRDKVAFSGSANFSSSALFHNIESVSCYKSWLKERSEEERLNYYDNLFDKIWKGRSKVVRILPLDKLKSTIRDRFPIHQLEDLVDKEQQLIDDLLDDEFISNRVKQKIRSLKKALSENQRKNSNEVKLPDLSVPIELREYQSSAIEAWFGNNHVGLLEMATGTGKTITALSAAVRFVKVKERMIVVIACPFIHLVEQWIDESEKFGFRPLLVAESGAKWQPLLARELQLFKRGVNKLLVIGTTNASLASTEFQKLMSEFWVDSLFISDESHYLGSPTYRKLLPQDCKYRLGLSATPERYYDEEGTSHLLDFFQKVVYRLPMEEAIGKFLTPYYYHAIPLEMNPDEFEEYASITNEIEKLLSFRNDKYDDRIEKLSIKRARIQNNSKSKINWISENVEASADLRFALFYSGDQAFDQVKRILGVDKKIRLHEFTGDQSRLERKNILGRFSKGELQALMAMKCLDEGVDVPATRIAYFLASSGNPREFIQRRGRVLRKSAGKEFAIIYDLIAIPPYSFIQDSKDGESYNAVRSSFRKEYKRVREFSKLAINSHTSLDQMFDFANQLELLST